MNVLDLRGPQFLQLYLALLAAVTIAAILLRWLLRSPADDLPWPLPKYLPLELAYLSGGPQGAVNAAIAGLVQSGAIEVDAATRRLSAQPKDCRNATVLERVVYSLAAKGSGKIDDLRAAAKPMADEFAFRLQKQGLVLSDERATVVRLFPAMLILALLALGIAKIYVGISRNRPVEILIFLCIVTAAIAVPFIAKRPLRTRRGDRVLGKIKSQNAALEETASTGAKYLSDEDLTLAFALFGPAVLAGGTLTNLRTALFPPPRQSDGWFHGCGSAGSSCGSSCGGASGCGGGGCGGGGCGGCGGG